MADFFEIQPSSCRATLPVKEIIYDEWILKEHPEYIIRWEKTMFFDPTEIYNKISELIDPHKRIHAISITKLFPDIPGYCSCGCGVEIKPHRRFAKPECSGFAWDVRNIICNVYQVPHRYITRYFGNKCDECKDRSGDQLDHIIGVAHGGGGCWLSNYRWLCTKCHRNKTNTDFGFKALSKTQMKIDL